MFMGITFEKLLLIGVLAAFLIGPERLPRAAETLARWVRRGRDYLRGAQSRLRDEMGPEFDEVDWRKLDPRQYDPRRIIRDALFEEPEFDSAPAPTPRVVTDPVAPPPARPAFTREVFSRTSPPPFDVEAT